MERINMLYTTLSDLADKDDLYPGDSYRCEVNKYFPLGTHSNYKPCKLEQGNNVIHCSESEAEFLRSLIGSPLPLESTIVKNLGISGRIRKDILRVLDMLLQFDARGTIKIEPIFEYSPYINLNANSGRFLGKRIFPIGDSLFCGHPKMGNGLANHLDFVNRILQRISRLEI